MKHSGLRDLLNLVVLMMAIIVITACTPSWKKPVPLDQVDFLSNSKTLSGDGMTVTVSVPTREEAKEIFGTDLYREQIQPVWVEIESTRDKRFMLMKPGLDEQYYSPLEAAFQRHSGSKEIKREMDLFFFENSFRNPVEANSSTSGFVFATLDEGYKAINIDLVADQEILNYSFVVEVPGLVTDHSRVNFDAVHSEWIELDSEEALRAALEVMPCCTANEDGTEWGDPLNIAMVGERQHIFSALVRRGWHQTEVNYSSSIWKTIKSFMFGTRYRYSPISPLYVYDRPQDIGMQKARDSIHLRNHMRLWRSPFMYKGMEVYIGQISRDIGVKFSKRTITTHAIDPDVDNTRNNLLTDLGYSQSLSAFAYVKGSQVSTFEDTHYNLTPDPYYSDGNRVVMFFDERTTALNGIKIMHWERMFSPVE